MRGGSKLSPHSASARSRAVRISSRPCSSARANGPGTLPAPAIIPMSMSLIPAIPSSSTRQASTRVLRPERSTSVSSAGDVVLAVLIEPLPRLLPEIAGFNQLLHRRCDEEPLAVAVAEVLGHVEHGVVTPHVC